ncbi:MAG: polyphosphate polymerase domain-containing protein [Lachnospiraceae bacterium]|nr:polyphosphate polymerase domain-containing protein [Lachnospiraceae bacterium]
MANRYRHEYKYIIDACQEEILKIRAMGVMAKDGHVDADGTYTIRSLYFDDIDNTCFYENQNGTDPRSKFRIRYYGLDTSRISLEKKSKKSGMTFKESCLISEEECTKLMNGEYITDFTDASEMKKKLLLELQVRRLLPKTIVTYNRIPFVYSAGNVRVTFDRMITSSDDVKAFLTGEYRQRPVMEAGSSILEVKWDEVLPLHIKDVLSIDSLSWTAFSKYYMCRVHHL